MPMRKWQAFVGRFVFANFLVGWALVISGVSMASERPTVQKLLEEYEYIKDVMYSSTGSTVEYVHDKGGDFDPEQGTSRMRVEFAVRGEDFRVGQSYYFGTNVITLIEGWNPRYRFVIQRDKGDIGKGRLSQFEFLVDPTTWRMDSASSQKSMTYLHVGKVLSCPWCVVGSFSLPAILRQPGAQVDLSVIDNRDGLIRLRVKCPRSESGKLFEGEVDAVLDSTNRYAIQEATIAFGENLALHLVKFDDKESPGTGFRRPIFLRETWNPEPGIDPDDYTIRYLKDFRHEAKPESYFTVEQFGFAEPKRSDDVRAIKPGNSVSWVLIASVILLLTVGGLVAFIRRRTPKTAVNQPSEQPPASEG